MRSSDNRRPTRREYSFALSASCLLLLPGSAADGVCEGQNAQLSCCPDGDGGLVLPVFPSEPFWNKNLRATLYCLGLLYCFVGVSVLSDAFMSGIERITNSTYRKKIKRIKPNGRPAIDKKTKQPIFDYKDELIWNPTVANLTLMALGSSTPEILLSMIEIAGDSFFSGDLGPGTVVGSASFNLYMITAFCMVALPAGVGRKIEGTTVFTITATFSLLAYMWMALVLLYISPDIVELWEALVTLGACPLLVFIAYCADKNWFRGPRVHPAEIDSGNDKEVEGSTALQAVADDLGSLSPAHMPRSDSLNSLNSVTSIRAVRRQSSFHRVVARIISIRTLGKHSSTGTMGSSSSVEEEDSVALAHCAYSFSSSKYCVLESAPAASICVRRTGKTDIRSAVWYSTSDDTATAGREYDAVEGRLEFGPQETEAHVMVPLKSTATDSTGLKFRVALAIPERFRGKIGLLSQAEVTISDQDQPGQLAWVETDPAPLSSLSGQASVAVERREGWRGEVSVHVTSVDDTARAGVHFEPLASTLHFAEGEALKTLQVKLHQFEKPAEGAPAVLRFFLDLASESMSSEPQALAGGQRRRMEVRVRWEESPVIGLEETTWPEQFRNAFAIGEDVGYEEASWGRLGLHVVALLWKILAACIPPPQYLGGWACFGAGLSLIGVVTMLINDLASIFGCLVGLNDQVTAITVVALGTSLPDTFASVLAIRSDANADNAIGNITGSNSINVFLGLGLPWTVASLYWRAVGASPAWLAKYAGWSRLELHRDAGAFVVIGGALGFNTLLFASLSLLAFAVLALRRRLLGCEIGGPKHLAWATAGLLVLLWLVYITLSSLQVYHPQLLQLDLGYDS